MYSKKYFKWQSECGDFGSMVDQYKFDKFVDKNKKILEFGCGGGYLLSKLSGKEKIGIEINPSARAVAKKNGIKTVSSYRQVKNNWADLIISNHALEHCTHPLLELKNLYRKLRKNGTIVFVTPHERNTKYVRNDLNQHLYTWSELNIANLFALAGYRVQIAETLKTAWPPRYQLIYALLGPNLFKIIADVYGRFFFPIWEVRIIAKKV